VLNINVSTPDFEFSMQVKVSPPKAGSKGCEDSQEVSIPFYSGLDIATTITANYLGGF
jgi:hypothetical protein